MNNKITPVKNIRVMIKSLSGDIIIGNININGFDRYSDFMDKNISDCISISKAMINGDNFHFVTVFKSNIAYIQPEIR